ncbi:hypothetical protein LTR85_011981 [Meristemomyces frigidus]|nr:hypothetical protein LTR85_011981 [Meristemomyces frigidus]
MIEQLVRNPMVVPSHPHLQAAEVSSPEDAVIEANSISSRNLSGLPPGAVARFERLRDRIDLCAITELEECIAEKDGLVQMNFNLIALRQAQTVERLTRTTILLAKLTTLFLPLSLAMNYFSMQLKDLNSVPVRTFWLTFMVVAIIAVTFLVGFEWLSNRYSGQLVYKGLTRSFVDHQRRRKP